ncbi:MAG TPA: hypothetical protein VGK54_12535 [Chloroflexota bacterium]|jgi:hypothetical protein
MTLAAMGILGVMYAPAALAQGQRTPISGTIDSAGDDWLAFTDGTTLTLTPDTRITLSRAATAADLEPGMFVAITAVRDMDDYLLASIINVFPDNARGREGQFPLTGDNLMTNASIEEATIDEIGSMEFSVSFNGEMDRVRLAPGVRINLREAGATADLQPGLSADIFATDGVATNVTVYPSPSA